MGQSISATVAYGYVWDPEEVDEGVAERLDQIEMNEWERLEKLGVELVNFGDLVHGWWYICMAVAPTLRVNVLGELDIASLMLFGTDNAKSNNVILNEALQALGLEAPEPGPKWYVGACVS